MAASKLPDLNEVTKFTSKLLKDIKQSVGEIYNEYKSTREDDDAQSSGEPKPETKQETRQETPEKQDKKTEQDDNPK